MTPGPSAELDQDGLELRLLLEAIHGRYGVDFRGYAKAALRRRVLGRLEPEGVNTIAGLLERVLHDPDCMQRLFQALTIHVTSMFRDPGFYRALRERVVPVLRTYPFVRVWHAGCSTGEEVYSLAIVLEEEGLLDRCRIYATDLSEDVLEKARAGIFPLRAMKEYTANYQEAGGRAAFSSYYTAAHDAAVFRASLRDAMVFAQHSLVSDASFQSFHVILCRNVLIYFERALQDRVHDLLYGSLCRLGTLALGRRESLRNTPFADCYQELDAAERLYRKVR